MLTYMHNPLHVEMYNKLYVYDIWLNIMPQAGDKNRAKLLIIFIVSQIYHVLK